MLKLLKNLSAYTWLIITVFILIFLQAMTNLFLPTLMGNIVDNGIILEDIPYILKIGGIMLLVSAVGVVVTVTASYLSSKVAMSFGRDIRKRVFTHVESFSLEEFDEFGTASLITRTTNDITQVQQVVLMMLRMVIMAPLMLLGGVIMAVSKDAKLSLTILVILPFLILTIGLILRKAMPLFKRVQKRLDELNLVMRENLTGIRVIRAFNKEDEEQERLEKANFNLTDVSIKVNKIMALLMPLMTLLMNLTIVAVIWFGGIRIDSGGMALGDLMAFIQYISQIMFALLMASMMFVIIPRGAVSANRIMDVLNTEAPAPKEGEESADRVKGLLEFDQVTFHYPGAKEPALKDINFTAKPGKVTAIIGGTGSGKTTLINLIPRFYEVSSGSIYINGVNINETTLEDIRSRIGLVPQQALLFSGTIADNIRYGNEDATDDEVRHAARIAQADDFIMASPEGYDTIVDQGGTNLSGGQKQRVSIARALIRQPDIYLLDDSFSALDFKTDAKLRSALESETTEATLLIVAQRVSTVKNADQIIVLDQGEMVGIGTHEDLLKSNHVYQQIVDSQMGEGERDE